MSFGRDVVTGLSKRRHGPCGQRVFFAQLESLTDEWFAPYGEEDKAKILWRKCARLYGLL
jgi:hypothetical protein